MDWYEISLSVLAKTDETPDEEVVMRTVIDALMNVFDDVSVIVDYIEKESE